MLVCLVPQYHQLTRRIRSTICPTPTKAMTSAKQSSRQQAACRGVMGWRQWLDERAGGGPFGAVNAEPTFGLNAFGKADRRQLLDRRHQHTDQCTSCSKVQPLAAALHFLLCFSVSSPFLSSPIFLLFVVLAPAPFFCILFSLAVRQADTALCPEVGCGCHCGWRRGEEAQTTWQLPGLCMLLQHRMPALLSPGGAGLHADLLRYSGSRRSLLAQVLAGVKTGQQAALAVAAVSFLATASQLHVGGDAIMTSIGVLAGLGLHRALLQAEKPFVYTDWVNQDKA